MKSDVIESIDHLLTEYTGSTSFKEAEIPGGLLDSGFINKEVRLPQRCPLESGCKEPCSCEIKEDEVQIECDAGHTGSLPLDEHTYYDLSFVEILHGIADVAGLEISDVNSSSSPRYVSASTAEGFNLYMVVSPSNYQATINQICVETLSEDAPALLITPEEHIDDLLEIKALFSSGNLIYTATLSMLEESEEVRRSLQAIEEVRSLESRVLEDLDDEHKVVYRINSNPRYILTELNHMRLLRLAGELPQSSGTRLEKVAESVFSHLFVTNRGSGGEDDRGSNLPDSLFLISKNAIPEGYESVLGIVDTKSGKDASFGSEPVEGKHDEYLNRARRESVGADLRAHIFVVLGFDGQKEFDFFDEMASNYKEGEYMIIFTDEALSMIMSAYLSHTLSNELKLVHGNFNAVIYPFFSPEQFRDADLGEIIREVGQKPEEYRRRYQERNNLIIVTSEVVRKRIRDCCESPGDAEGLLNSYFRPLPTV